MRGWGFAAVVLILLLSASVTQASSGIYKEKYKGLSSLYFPNRSELCSDPFIINSGGPYTFFENESGCIDIEIIGGTLPVTLEINWKDGKYDEKIIHEEDERVIKLYHTYSTVDTYEIIICGVDNLGKIDDDTTTIKVIKRKCDLYSSISLYPEYPLYRREGEKIVFLITVSNTREGQTCKHYEVNVVINPGNLSFPIITEDHPIGPGGCEEFLLPIDGLKSLWDVYTATVTVICNEDIKPDNNDDYCFFFVFDGWFCKILDELPDRMTDTKEEILDIIHDLHFLQTEKRRFQKLFSLEPVREFKFFRIFCSKVAFYHRKNPDF